ncbi:hypothetical protein [Thermoflexus sp.]|uniref:hypothetical protein n=1 Tax=Thermoflexus sp. TaxID=1969742 RepID=UPI0025FABC57|nr:hypothetical protein [Thermoflexus sp.]MCS7350102.1 hypothetical protein [Thermoflexus sp.]MCX7689466.1 hypothetical protein [Thermoflexus sp.]MDW8179551.1 hypothetical protein [Anaerolineae bacterium]
MRGRPGIAFLAGLLPGLVGGLYLAWEIFPPPPGWSSPAELAGPYQELWIVLAAQADAVERDPGALQRRLEALALPDLPDRVAALAERGLLENWPSGIVQDLAHVAQQLGARSPALVVILATPVPTRLPPSPTLIPTPTASPTPTPSPTVTLTPPPSPTPIPTHEPSPTPVLAGIEAPTSTPTPSVPQVVERQPLCEASPLLRIHVLGPDGKERSGVRVWVSGPRGTETLLTGLKPGMGEGYADAQMEPQRIYRFGIEGLELTLEEVVARPCERPEGQTGWTGWEVWVRLPR